MQTETQGRPVLVTTEHRGVFFGYLDGELSKERLTLKKIRNCLYWGTGVKGFIGLSQTGPDKASRVGPAADEATIFDITAVIACTPEAVKAWEAAPWN
jgi:hypothetical protein